MSRETEQDTMKSMIELFCKGQGHPDPICPECTELIAYARARLTACAYGDDKPTCRQCPIHCYRPDMRERITAVMRYAGPRMLLHHPVQGVRHLIHDKRSRPKGAPQKADRTQHDGSRDNAEM
jgi:hypothetical protein